MEKCHMDQSTDTEGELHHIVMLQCPWGKRKIWTIGKPKHPTSMPKPIPKAFKYRSNQQV